ncbi:hypothetical protein ACJJIX_20100 [Microbulbifer sp. VAAC004]|uniref:hypothetical protein n=1 Tax=unclassified Microbulbifer TaxID=2619833 RepID=UPI00403A531B
MKYLLSVVLLSCSALASAAGDSNFSIGLGGDHAGLGAKYAINRGKDKYFGAFGWLGYTEQVGWIEGYGIGWERLVSSDSHSVGTFLGTVSHDTVGEKVARYHGISLLYNYYFSGFSEASFVIGVDVYAGASSEDERYFDGNKAGASLKVAYQW